MLACSLSQLSARRGPYRSRVPSRCHDSQLGTIASPLTREQWKTSEDRSQQDGNGYSGKNRNTPCYRQIEHHAKLSSFPSKLSLNRIRNKSGQSRTTSLSFQHFSNAIKGQENFSTDVFKPDPEQRWPSLRPARYNGDSQCTQPAWWETSSKLNSKSLSMPRAPSNSNCSRTSSNCPVNNSSTSVVGGTALTKPERQKSSEKVHTGFTMDSVEEPVHIGKPPATPTTPSPNVGHEPLLQVRYPATSSPDHSSSCQASSTDDNRIPCEGRSQGAAKERCNSSDDITDLSKLYEKTSFRTNGSFPTGDLFTQLDGSLSEPRKVKTTYLQDHCQSLERISRSEPRILQSRIPRPILQPGSSLKDGSSFSPSRAAFFAQTMKGGESRQPKTGLEEDVLPFKRSPESLKRVLLSQNTLRQVSDYKANQLRVGKSHGQAKSQSQLYKPLPAEPPVARHINFRFRDENIRIPSGEAISDPFWHSSAEPQCKGNVGTLFAEIRRLKYELDIKNEVCSMLIIYTLDWPCGVGRKFPRLAISY